MPSDVNAPSGHIPGMLQWVKDHEPELQQCFLDRFQNDIRPDTRQRFLDETATNRVEQRIYQAAHDFDRTRRDLVNARARLQDQLKSRDEKEQEEAYLTTIRSGRQRLTREQRRQIWVVFQMFQRGLYKRHLLTFEGAIHQARLAVEHGHFPIYRHVLVDEVQDFSLEALRLIRALSPLDQGAFDPLCLVGDGHQRIHRAKIPLSRAGIDVRGRSRRLKIN